jgi:DNA-binding PadR family transcriptional regulator
MKNTVYLILLSLAADDRHGSGIMRDVLDLTDGEVRLWPATLYGTLDELRANGWIDELSDPAERPEGESERKRFYRITRAGRRTLAAETERLASVVEEARARMTERRA